MNKISLTKRILLPLALILSLLFAGFIFVINRQLDLFDVVTVESASQIVASNYQQSLDNHAEKMIGLLELMATDDRISEALVSGSRQQMLEVGMPLFEHFRKLNITHFYFHSADRVNLLRVHQPPRFGDLINRTTAIEAVKTGKPFWGAELGPLGTFTLRVVKPIYVQNKLVGLLELGEEVDHLITRMKAFLGVDVVVTIDKQFLKRASWESGMAMLKRQADWDQFSSVVVNANSIPNSSPGFLGGVIVPSHEESMNHHQLNGKEYVAAKLSLVDVGQRQVGKLFVLYDVTYLSKETRDTTVLAAGIAASLALILLFIFYRILSRTEKVIDASQQKIAHEHDALIEAQKLARIGSWELDLIHNELWWSDECYLIFERDKKPGVASYADFLESIHPEDRHLVDQVYTESLEKHTEYNVVHRLKMPDGRIKYVNEIGESIYDENGKAVRSAGTIQDITERLQSEKAIHEKDGQIRLLLDSTAEAIYGIDLDGNCTFANAACLRMLGYDDVSELIGENMHTLIHHTHANGSPYPQKECRIYEAFRTGVGTHVDDEVMWRKDGSSFPVSYWSHTVTKDDQITGSVVAFLDITEQIKNRDELEISHAQLMASLEGTISTITKIVDARDPYTAGHQQRVADLASNIAREMGLDENLIVGISLGAKIHDIGKINVPAELLSKPTKLTNIEYMLIQSHPQVGSDILKDIEFPWPVAEIAHQHHERMDGSGYPKGLKGDEIILEARVVAVADVVEAMASHRPYRPGLGIDEALDEIMKNRGNFYDPQVVDACLRLFKEKGYTLS
ncbi:MAG: PAS domain S-box protein [Zhongshania sp.]|nr:PAS domain S-box protein [Zhongshania sp.]